MRKSRFSDEQIIAILRELGYEAPRRLGKTPCLHGRHDARHRLEPVYLSNSEIQQKILHVENKLAALCLKIDQRASAMVWCH